VPICGDGENPAGMVTYLGHRGELGPTGPELSSRKTADVRVEADAPVEETERLMREYQVASP
jgi:hypothetical protein